MKPILTHWAALVPGLRSARFDHTFATFAAATTLSLATLAASLYLFIFAGRTLLPVPPPVAMSVSRMLEPVILGPESVSPSRGTAGILGLIGTTTPLLELTGSTTPLLSGISAGLTLTSAGGTGATAATAPTESAVSVEKPVIASENSSVVQDSEQNSSGSDGSYSPSSRHAGEVSADRNRQNGRHDDRSYEHQSSGHKPSSHR